MKSLGIKQFHQMSFKYLPLDGSPFQGILGNVPRNFIAVVSGFSGNGKTEFSIQWAKELTQHGKVAWMSYEQRHGADLQAATIRNRMEESSGKFIPIDPLKNIPPGMSYLEDLDNYLKKRNSPEYIFIDSLDYTGFSWEDYVYLKNTYGHKKTLIFLAHSTKTGKLKKAISERIVFDGGMNLWVKDFIARPEKNRFGGLEPYVINEERARERNPTFFNKRKDRKPRVSGKKTGFDFEGKPTKITNEAQGVDAGKQPKKQDK